MKNLDIVRCYLNNERPYAKIGWLPENIKRKIGDTWEDANGMVYEQKNGYVLKQSRMAKAIRDVGGGFARCKISGREIDMSNKSDRMAFLRTGKCFDVLIEEETQMKIDGTFKFYEEKKILENAKSFGKDFLIELETALNYLTNKLEFINENGTIDEWLMNNKSEIKKDLKKKIKTINKEISLIDKKIVNLDKKLCHNNQV